MTMTRTALYHCTSRECSCLARSCDESVLTTGSSVAIVPEGGREGEREGGTEGGRERGREGGWRTTFKMQRFLTYYWSNDISAQ